MNSLLYILSSTTNPDWIKDALRTILFTICKGIFTLIEDIFNLFFQIVNFEMFSGDVMEALFSRLFMITGIFMLFKLGVSLISYLVNPDTIKDKERGIGKMFSRLVVMLVLLLVLMPWPSFSLWESDTTDMTAQERNELYQDNGLLFGLLYDAQKRIINDGTISMLILGEKIDNRNTLNEAGKTVSVTILSAFAPINQNCDSINANGGITFKTLDDIGNRIEERCTAKGSSNKEYYLFDFSGFTAILVGLGTCIIVFLFCFDVAIRMIKLGILRILSPIPAISYIDPKSSRDGTFAAYIKTLTSTYLDLFIRLAIIFLVIYLISIISQNDKGLFSTSGGNPGSLAKAIIYISLLFFAGQAPKFIQQSLGIKSKGTGLGFGAALLGGALSGMISGAATGGAWGALTGIATGARAGSQNQWAAQNGQKPNISATQAARDRVAQNNTGNYNAKGRSLSAMVGSRIGNRIKGMDRDDVNTAKNTMYYLEGKARSAHNDFTNNTAGVMDVPGSSKWKDLAEQDKQAVLAATEKVEKAKQTIEEMKMAARSGHDIPSSIFNGAQEALSTAETELTLAQKQQQTDYDAYNNFINAEYGKAKKHYEIGDENLKRNDEQHVYRSRPHVFGSKDEDRYNYDGGNGGRYDHFDQYHPHK